MLVKLLVVCLLSCIHSINSASAPFIKKCHLSDTKCLKASAQAAVPNLAAGIPELGVDVLEPFHLKILDASSPNLKLALKDVIGNGLSKCVFKKVDYDNSKAKLNLKLLCTIEVEGQYDIKGNIILLPVEGNGHAHVILKDMVISVAVNIGTKNGKDGITHWTIKSYEHSFILKEKGTIELDNLFNGNEALGRAAKDLFKSNPNEIITEVGPPIVSAVVKLIVENVNRFFHKVQLSELIEQ